MALDMNANVFSTTNSNPELLVLSTTLRTILLIESVYL